MKIQACALGALTLAAVSLSPGQVQAEELITTVYAATAYDSNQFGADDANEDGGMVYRVGPEFSLRDNRADRFDYILFYRGDYEIYDDREADDAFEHRQRLRMRYAISPRTEVVVNQRYRDISNLQFDQDDFDAGDTGIDVRSSDYDRLDFSVELNHEISQTWRLSTEATYQLVDFKRNFDRSDSDTASVALRLFNRVSRRQDIGLGLRYASQSFDRATDRLEADSKYYTLSLLWNYRFSEFITLEVEGGPTWIDSEQSVRSLVSNNAIVSRRIGDETEIANFAACGSLPGTNSAVASRCRFNNALTPPLSSGSPGDIRTYALTPGMLDFDDRDTVFFGRAELNAQFGDWTLGLSYQRQQSSTAGEALAASLDQLRFSLEFQINDAWSSYLAVRSDRRDKLTDAWTVDYNVIQGADGEAIRDTAFLRRTQDDAKREIVTALLGTTYRVTRQLQIGLELRERNIERDLSVAGIQDSESFIAELSLRYDFAPMRL